MENVVDRLEDKKKSILLTLTLIAGYSMVFMDRTMIGTAVIPISEEYNLTAGQAGLIMSIFFLGMSVMQIPGGWLADKIGPKKVLMVSLGAMSLFAFSFGFVSSLALFMTIRLFGGLGQALYPPSCSKAIGDNFPKERRTFIQSLVLSSAGIGGVLAFTLGANLISLNWRYAYYVLGTLFLIGLVLVYLFVPNKVEPVGEKVKPTIKFSQVIRNRNILILFISMLLLNILTYGTMSWMPSFLVQKFTLDIRTVGMLLAVSAIFQTGATILTGVLLSKMFLGKERLFLFCSTMLSAVLVFALIASTNVYVSLVIVILLSMLGMGAFVGIFTWPHKMFDSSIIGSSIGIVNSGGTTGGILAPVILGQLITVADGSFSLAFSFMAIASIACGFCILGVKPKGEC